MKKKLEITNRRVWLKFYPNSFFGRDVVSWLFSIKRIASSQKQGVLLARMMIDYRFIKHAKDTKNPFGTFKDDVKSLDQFVEENKRQMKMSKSRHDGLIRRQQTPNSYNYNNHVCYGIGNNMLPTSSAGVHQQVLLQVVKHHHHHT